MTSTQSTPRRGRGARSRAARSAPTTGVWATALLVGVAVATALTGVDPPPAAALAAPRWTIAVPGGVHGAAPVAADLDGDGADEVVVAGLDGWVRAWSSAGQLRWERPVDPTGGGVGTAVDATPTVVDLDGDGRPEVLVAAGTLEVRDQAGGLVVFGPDGAVRWRATFGDVFDAWDPGWGTRGDGLPEPVLASPVVGDVDGDGGLDVVVAALDNRVHVLSAADGSPRPGWVTDHPGFEGSGYWVDDALFGPPLVADVDGDGRDEVFVGVTASPGGTISHAGGAFVSLEWEGGAARTRWVQFADEVITGHPVAVDLDLDGRLEAVVGTGLDYARSDPRRADARRLLAFRLDDGSRPPGWPVDLDGGSYASAPAVGDLDGDGRPDVVAPSDRGGLWALRGDGSVLWHSGTGGGYHSPVIADLDGDGDQDVLAGTLRLRGSDGGVIDGAGPTTEAASAVAYLGGGGWAALVPGPSSVSAHPLTRPGDAADWPQERGGPARTGIPSPTVGIEGTPGGAGYWTVAADGRVDAFGAATHLGMRPGLAGGEHVTSLAATPTGHGYWLFTDRGRAFAFGDAVHRGDMAGTPLNGPVLDSTTTPSGRGYYMVASDGGVFAFGDARFWGSMGGTPLNQPVQSLVPDPDGAGYWLVAADGGVFAFQAGFRGSVPAVLTPGQRLNAPVTGMVPYGDGYVLVAADGGAFVFSDRPFTGSLGDHPPPQPVVDIAVVDRAGGYWMVGRDGRVYAFGAARAHPLS